MNFTLHFNQVTKKGALILTLPSKFTTQINCNSLRITIIAKPQCVFPSSPRILTIYALYNYSMC
jgi:hypothetical protein